MLVALVCRQNYAAFRVRQELSPNLLRDEITRKERLVRRQQRDRNAYGIMSDFAEM